ncbi:hypothetical protein JCM31271_28080 [Halorubrum trueperi]
MGANLEVELHVEVPGDYTLRTAHEIETVLIDRLRDLPAVGDAHVHLDPAGTDEWKDADEDGSPVESDGSGDQLHDQRTNTEIRHTPGV